MHPGSYRMRLVNFIRKRWSMKRTGKNPVWFAGGLRFRTSFSNRVIPIFCWIVQTSVFWQWIAKLQTNCTASNSSWINGQFYSKSDKVKFFFSFFYLHTSSSSKYRISYALTTILRFVNKHEQRVRRWRKIIEKIFGDNSSAPISNIHSFGDLKLGKLDEGHRSSTLPQFREFVPESRFERFVFRKKKRLESAEIFVAWQLS